MPDTEIQKEMSEAYLRAVVFRAGFDLYEPKNDRGIDGTIGDPNRRGRGIDRIDYQLKSTTRYEIRDANIIYDLRVDNYNQLGYRNRRAACLDTLSYAFRQRSMAFPQRRRVDIAKVRLLGIADGHASFPKLFNPKSGSAVSEHFQP